MSASDNAKGYSNKGCRFHPYTLSLLVAVAACCPQAIAQAEAPPVSIACSPNGTLIATARIEGGVRISDLTSGKSVISLENESVEGMVFSPNGQLLATHDDSHVELWALVVSERQAVSKGDLFSSEPLRHLTAIAFSPDGKILAVGSLGVDHLTFKSYGEVSLWDVANRKKIMSFKGQMDGVHSLAFSPDGTTLAVGTGQGSAHATFHRLKGTVQLWDVTTGHLKPTLKPTPRLSWVESVAFSPDGKTLATAASRIEGDLLHVGWQLVSGVELWDVATVKERAFLKGDENDIGHLVFSPDGSKLATADLFEMKLWDTATGTQQASLKNVWAPLTFSKDGKKLATLLLDGSVKWSDVEKLPKATPRK